MREIRIVIPDPDDVVPEEFVIHMLNAAREFMLALRSLIDAGLERIDTAEEIVRAKREIRKIEIE